MKVPRVARLVSVSAALAPAALAAAALAAAALAAPTLLRAQGFGVNEIGACAVGRGFAVTASPCHDASTIFWNSAAATSVNGWNVVAGVSAIGVASSFTQDTTGLKFNGKVPTQWAPHAFINYHSPTSSLAYGLGVYVPYGLTSQWGNDFPGRFEALKASLQTVYVQPNIAWQITPNWSIGGGPIYGHSSVELIQAVDLSQQLLPTGATFAQIGIAPGTEFAQARLKGSANGWGAQVAIQGKLTQSLTVGARFLTPIEFKYTGATATFTQVPTNLIVGGDLPGPTAATTIPAGTPVDLIVAPQFQSGGALVSQTASTKITHPAQIQAGLAFTGIRDVLLEADYAFVGYKRFDVLPVTFTGPAQASSRVLLEDYNNSSAIRLGAQYTMPEHGWQIRAGFDGVQSAAPDVTVTPLLPEQDRNYYTVGLGIPLTSQLTIDGSYARVQTPGRRGRISERTSTNEALTAAQLNSGVFDLSANVFAITLKASF